MSETEIVSSESKRLRDAIDRARNEMNVDMAEDDARAHRRVMSRVDAILADALGQESGPPELSH